MTILSVFLEVISPKHTQSADCMACSLQTARCSLQTARGFQIAWNINITLSVFSKCPYSVFIAGPSNNLLGIFSAFSYNDEAFNFVAPENWSFVHVGWRILLYCQRIKINLATFLGVPEAHYQEQSPMRTDVSSHHIGPRSHTRTYAKHCARVNVSTTEYSRVAEYLAKFYDRPAKLMSHHAAL